jgi:DNA-binding transcriptional MerR regulator
LTLYIYTGFTMNYIWEMKKYTIGQLAKETGIKIGTIRFYEKYGLISKPFRRESGYREFTQEHKRQIEFIKRAKTLSFTLKEILEISAKAKMDKRQSRNEIQKCVEAKIRDVEAGISYYQTARKSLLSLLEECSSSTSFDDCTLFKLL